MMALRRSTGQGLRLLLRQQELYGGLPWQSVATELHELSSRQLLPACCALLHPQHGVRPWHGDDWRYNGDRRSLHASYQHWQSAQPAIASLTEEEEEQARRNSGQACTSSQARSHSERERGVLHRHAAVLSDAVRTVGQHARPPPEPAHLLMQGPAQQIPRMPGRGLSCAMTPWGLCRRSAPRRTRAIAADSRRPRSWTGSVRRSLRARMQCRHGGPVHSQRAG